MAHLKPLTVEWTTWDNAELIEVTSWQEAESLIERVGSQADHPPCLVEFYNSDTGQSLGLGVGRTLTVVTYQDSLNPPYFISLGNKERVGTEWFCYGNEETEYLATNLVPMDQGKTALKHFVENRTQPENLAWERL
jgi:hypothetical protein